MNRGRNSALRSLQRERCLERPGVGRVGAGHEAYLLGNGSNRERLSYLACRFLQLLGRRIDRLPPGKEGRLRLSASPATSFATPDERIADRLGFRQPASTREALNEPRTYLLPCAESAGAAGSGRFAEAVPPRLAQDHPRA